MRQVNKNAEQKMLTWLAETIYQYLFPYISSGGGGSSSGSSFVCDVGDGEEDWKVVPLHPPLTIPFI